VNVLLHESAHAKHFVTHIDKLNICHETESLTRVSFTDSRTEVEDYPLTSNGDSASAVIERPKRLFALLKYLSKKC